MVSQKLTKTKLDTKKEAISASNRIKDIFEKQEQDLDVEYDGTTKKPKLQDLTVAELKEYREDLAKDLMVFQMETNEFMFIIRKIGKILKMKSV